MSADPADVKQAVLGTGAVFDHVAYAGPRIRDMLAIYQDLLGGVFWEGGDNTRVGYRALQLRYRDGTRFELMEPLPGSTFFDSFFARTGGGGLHHITFKVDDVRSAATRLEELGYTPHGLYLDDPAWQEVFMHPRETGGVLVQLAQGSLPGAAPAITLEDVLAGRVNESGVLTNGS
jgi:methylmalonyl-CoA/ethylmalonyl-CoA epimerase